MAVAHAEELEQPKMEIEVTAAGNPKQTKSENGHHALSQDLAGTAETVEEHKVL